MRELLKPSLNWLLALVPAAIWIAGQISGDGESNWLEGIQLLAVYLALAITFYFLPEAPGAESAAGR